MSQKIKTTMTDGSEVTSDHRDIDPDTHQQKGYVILSQEERDKGFVRPVRKSYVHKHCGATTIISNSIAETYARDPKFYTGTFCFQCKTHFPIDQFWWEGTKETLGT